MAASDAPTRQRGGSHTPALSIVLATPETYEVIRTTVSHLRRQEGREQLELVIVAASRAALEFDNAGLDEAELAEFGSYQIVEVGEVRSVGSGNAAGVRRAKAPVIVLAEDHAFPQPTWAAELIRAHQEPWAAVGPGIINANPRTTVSWADLFIGYGPWAVPTTAREAEFLPGHNSSYKRDILLEYGVRLETMLQAETLLHWDLRAKGHRLYLQPAAVVAHTNFSLWSAWLPIQFHNPRAFAAERAQGKPLWWRCVYVLGSPLIPLVRFVRIARQRLGKGNFGTFLRTLPTLAVGLAIDGIGQLFGYAFGPGNSPEEIPKYEFHRSRLVTAADRKQLFLPPRSSDMRSSGKGGPDSGASDTQEAAKAEA